MNPNKTTILRFSPIAEITDDEMKEEVVTTNNRGHWCEGIITKDQRYGYDCIDKDGAILMDVKLYAVLPKDE